MYAHLLIVLCSIFFGALGGADGHKPRDICLLVFGLEVAYWSWFLLGLTVRG